MRNTREILRDMLRVIRAMILFCLIVGNLPMTPAAAQTTAPQTTAPQTTALTAPTVICPAIAQDERMRTNYPGEPSRPVELVVIGKVKTLDAGQFDTHYEVAVEKVLYGSDPGKTVRFSYGWTLANDRKIIALTSAPYGKDGAFDFRYDRPANDEKAQTALAAARLDYHAVAAKCIFVGRETWVMDDYLHEVLVNQPIVGPTPAAGEKVTVEIGFYSRQTDQTPTAHPEAMVYFVSEIQPEKAGKPRIYHIDCRLPADQLPAVREALARRDLYPVATRIQDGAQIAEREIGFRGTVADAVEMMGSPSEAAATLAARMLIRNKDTAIDPVVNTIRKTMLTQSTSAGSTPAQSPPAQSAPAQTTSADSPPNQRRFHQLSQLIQLLSAMDQGKSGGAIEKLLDQCLSAISATPRGSTTRPARETYYESEQQHDDVNHALVWLTMALEPKVADQWFDRLIKARDLASDPWKSELQLALSASSIQERAELTPALARMTARKPRVSSAALSIRGKQVAFSPDGQLLAVGTHLWHTKDWSPAGGFESDFSIADEFFSPDSQILYFAGGGIRGYLGLYDWNSGKVSQPFAGVTSGFESASLSRDAKVIAAVNVYDGKASVWDTATGKLLQSFAMPEHCYQATLSPDAKLLVWQSGREQLTVSPLDGGKTSQIGVPGYELQGVIFSPDGKWFVDVTGDLSEMRFTVHDTGRGFATVSVAQIDGLRCTRMAISPDSAHLVVRDQDGKCWCLSLPDLKTIRPIYCRKSSDGGLAFSPDGKLLAMGSNSTPLQIFQCDAAKAGISKGPIFEPVNIGGAHQDEVSDIHFSTDEKQLRTVGRSGDLCLWDAGTLNMLHRGSVPAGYKVFGVRGDGKYVVCCEGSPDRFPDRRNATPRNARVVDADTGNVVSSPKLPDSACVHWINDHEALLATTNCLCRFNYLTGQVTESLKIDNQNISQTQATLTDGGKSLLLLDGGGKSPSLDVSSLNLASGATTRIGQADLPTMTGNIRGVVPGDRYFYIGDAGLFVFDQRTLKPVASKSFTGADLFNLSFDQAGDRYAVALGNRILIDNDFRRFDPETTTLIRVQETLSGKTLAAFPSPTRWVQAMSLSPSGKLVALVDDNGNLYVWDIGP